MEWVGGKAFTMLCCAVLCYPGLLLFPFIASQRYLLIYLYIYTLW